MLETTATGKNIEKAIEDALLQLKATREDVDIKIIDEGGLFKKAKVFVKISDDCVDKYTKHQKLVNEEIEEEKKLKEEIEEKEEESTVVDKNEDSIIIEESIEIIENVDDMENEENTSSPDKKEENQSTQKTIEDYTDQIKIARSFISEIGKYFGADVELKCEVKEDNNLYLSIVGPNSSDLIGYRGECLNSIQNILNIILSNNSGNKFKAYLNIENYKEKREETLINLAKRTAKNVLKTKKSIKLDPMNSYERRIIHSALTDYSDIVTYSTGDEPKRCVVVCFRR